MKCLIVQRLAPIPFLDVDPKTLKYILLAIVGWCRYLLGVDDSGNGMQLRPYPLLDLSKRYVSGIKLGDSAEGKRNSNLG